METDVESNTVLFAISIMRHLTGSYTVAKF
jgi:hypothetical protein